MEQPQRSHIRRNLSKLIDDTGTISTNILAFMYGEYVFGDDDISTLQAITSERDKVWMFYQIVMTKNNSKVFQHLLTALEKECKTGALKILREPMEPFVPGIDDDETLGNRFDVDDHVHFFTGREQDLINLHNKLQKENKLQSVAIVGLGGVGKTELARCYIQRYMKLDDYVIWINGETEQTLAEGFRRLATDYLQLSTLNADGNEKNITSVIAEVYNYSYGKKTLFVFDNAKNNQVMQMFLPFRAVKKPLVLITSRFTEWSFGIQTLELLDLPQMGKGEAIEFVKSGLKIQKNYENHSTAKLVKRLQCHPLALTQAVSTIRRNQKVISNYTIEDYLRMFENDAAKLLNSIVPELLSYRETTLTTWKVTTDAIAATAEHGRKAIWMLNMISYFKPDKIPTPLLISHNPNFAVSKRGFWSRLLSGTRNKSSLDPCNTSNEYENKDALHLLTIHSMVKVDTTVDAISVHKLVQEVTRIGLKTEGLEESILADALQLLSTNTDTKYKGHLCSVFKYSIPYSSLIDECENFSLKTLAEYESHENKSDCDSDTEEEMKQEIQNQAPVHREFPFFRPKVSQKLRLVL